MEQQKNRRQFTRIPRYLEAEIDPGGADFVPGVTRDISVDGAFISCARALEEKSECQVTLYLDEARNVEPIRAKARIVRVTDKTSAAIQFLTFEEGGKNLLKDFLSIHTP